MIFIAALSDYDKTSQENNQQNKLHETLDVFDQVCRSKYFRIENLILFLNKKDLFETKIKETPLTICFPQYQGRPASYIDAIDFIQSKFECINETHRTNNELYVHVFDATELAGSRMLFDGILDMQLDSLTKSFQLL